ncbi:MAG: hydrolase [Bacillales bacterium]|jgi:cell wall-associated NlpC family hydrolase|nr:hydrolase [Bacillales bacterium]
MKKKVAILTTTLSILASTFYPMTTHAFTPDSEGKYLSPSAIESIMKELEESRIPKASFDTNKLVDMSKKYIGIKYLAAGKTPKGFDCSGFVGFMFKKSAGIDLPWSSDTMFEVGVPIERNNLQVGDLVFFKTGSKTISHVGIYIGNGDFIHSASVIGITISSLSEKYYTTRYQGAKRI